MTYSNFKNFCAIASILILGFLGWIFQYYGLLSITQTNFILIFLLFFPVLYRLSRLEFQFILYFTIFVFFLLLQVVLFGYGVNGTFVYLYYLICVVFSFYAGIFIFSNFGAISFYPIIFFLVIQLFFTSIQSFFTYDWIGGASIDIGFFDAISGTLFIQSDSTLSFCISFALLLTRSYSLSYFNRFLLFAISAIIVFSTNSIAGQIYFILVLLYSFGSFWSKTLSLVVFVFALMMFYFNLDWADFFDLIYSQFSYLYYGSDGSRLAPLGFVLFDELSIFGNGPLTYYNPLDKTWLFNSGFSAFYSWYFDYGFVGVVMFILLYIILFNSVQTSFHVFLIYFAGVMFFSFFNFSLSDMAFNMMLGYALCVEGRRVV